MKLFQINLQKALAFFERIVYYIKVGERKSLCSCKPTAFHRYQIEYFFKEDF